jgi:hypothetical protein
MILTGMLRHLIMKPKNLIVYEKVKDTIDKNALILIMIEIIKN